MNNNEFYINLDKIRKLYLKQNYDDAVKLADKIDFKRLKDWKYIAMLINLYEAVGRLEDVKYFCTLAYNRNLGGKKLVYKLAKVNIRLEDIDEAEDLYEEFVQMAPRDNKKFELLYELKAVQGAKKTELIHILEDYMKRDLDETYSYTLAELYGKTKQYEKCVNFCDRIIERFEAGDAVDKAIALKESIVNPKAGAPVNVRQAKVNVEFNNTVPVNVAAADTQSVPAQNMYATSEIPMQDMYATSEIPMQDMYATSEIPMQDMYATSEIPAQDMYATSEIPAQEANVAADFSTQETDAAEVPAQETDVTAEVSAQETNATSESAQDMYATSEIPVQEAFPTTEIPFVGDMDSIAEAVAEQVEKTVAQSVAEQTEIKVQDIVNSVEDAVSDNTVKAKASEETTETAVEVPVAEVVSETEEKEVTVADITADLSNITKAAATTNTVRVDTEAVNEALKEAAATMTVSETVAEPLPDIDSTMAIVEAALANETKAAQFDARMDMQDYAEEQVAPMVPEKITLRAFQPEIDKIYEIPMEIKRYFTKYSYVSGLEAKIGEYFESTKYEDKMGTSAIGNIIISGNRSSDKTSLAINIVKALNTLYPDNVRKIARTNGDNINQRGIERSVTKLLGSALIIEDAGVIDRQRVLELLEVMESNTQEMLIILEDSESEINELLKNNPELIEKFNHRITYKQFTVNELVEMCKRYAEKCKYTIDEKALLQLYLKIDDIHSGKDGVSLEDVRDVIDMAIESAQNRANKKLFGGVKKKKIGDKEFTILVESDFK